MKTFQVILLVTIVLTFNNCSSKHDTVALDEFSNYQLVDWNRKLSDVIIADIFTPPVASRIYAYTNVAAYEAVRFQDPKYKSLTNQLNELKAGPQPQPDLEYYLPLSGIVAFITVARELVWNVERIDSMEDQYLNRIRKVGINKDIYSRSVAFGRQVGKHILEWARQDGYNRRTANANYTVLNDPSRWQPTPPNYMEAIEPHWNTIRPFVLDSANQFNPGPPTAFDTIPSSTFYRETREVYDVVNNLDEERLAIAKFWDCNPNISFTQGHVMYYKQQISPGGHWVHITAQVLEATQATTLEAADTFAKVCVTIADAFISCWDEKYRSNLTRPETYINKYIDSDWKPILQTPAFPEHTSGHSVASTSAATVLTSLYGDEFTFIDSTEVPFGLPARHFRSFYEASNEAAVSRLYGGIHYRPAIEKGIQQGRSVGRYVINKISTTE